MSGSASLPTDPDDPEGPDRPRRAPRSHGWGWLLVVLGAFALLIVLVAEPWSVQTEPVETETAVPSQTAPHPSATPSVSVAPPGSTEMFGPTASRGLFVTAADLAASVPAAKPGVDQLVTSGQVPWGLPKGTVVDPASCALAVTVVGSPPAFYDARGWGNPDMTFRQEVTLLKSPKAAQEAFRELITTIDACPTYREVVDGADGPVWTAQPAFEGQGVYPSVVLQLDRTVGGTMIPGYQGQMLVGNAIVSWNAEALSTGSPQDALATLGGPESLSAMVQGRAQLAVRALR